MAYDTVAYHGGNAEEIYNRIIPYWVEEMGYAIDYDNIQTYDPNPELAASVRALMQQRGCDVSVLFVEAQSYYEYGTIGFDSVRIHEWFKSRGVYKTTVYPLHMREVTSWITERHGFPSADGLADLGAMSETAARERVRRDADFKEPSTEGWAEWNVSRFYGTFFKRPQRGHLYLVWCPYRGRQNANLFIGYFWVRDDGTCLNWIVGIA